MSGDGLRDEADSFREALPDDVLERAVRAACDVADWHWKPEYNGEHTIVPSPEHSMEPIVLAVIEAIGPTVAARIDAAREQVAEQIIEAIKVRREHWISLGEDLRYTAGLYEAVRIARQHAKGEQ